MRVNSIRFGPYHAPAVRRGERLTCLVRDAECTVTSWSDARICWPRGRRVGAHGGTTIIVTAELARAVRTESAAAVCHHWGVAPSTVANWRRALEVDRINNPTTHQLIRQSAQSGADRIKRRRYTRAEREATAQRNKALSLYRNLKVGFHGRRWTIKELRLLRRSEDNQEIAMLIGRSESAVRAMRCRLRQLFDE